MLHAVIMAGGSGTRFWPASRRDTPKQLLAVSGDRTMIQSTVDRVAGLVPDDRCTIVTSQRLAAAVRTQLPDVNLIAEPCKRDTAACIGLAAIAVLAKDPDATMLVMPSDHVIETAAAFQQAVTRGERLLAEDSQRIVTFGILPSYPAESFGYVQRGKPIVTDGQVVGYEVMTFREKPDLPTAREYCQSGSFYWNSGIFLWRASLILDLIRKFEPVMAAHLDAIGAAWGDASIDSVLDEHFAAIIGKSIDYAVMERHDRVCVIEAPFEWDDVGSWQAIARLGEPDSRGNCVRGKHVGIDTKNCIVYGSDDHAIVTIALDEMIVVRAGNATLVAPKHAEERVREAVKELERRQLDEFL